MKLHEWMKEAQMSDSDMAKAIGRERSVVTRIRNGRLLPSVKTAAAIQRLTGGRVTAVDYDKKEVSA